MRLKLEMPNTVQTSWAVLLIAFVGIGFVLSVPSPASFGVVDTTDPVFSREIVAYEMQNDGTVKYDYVANALPTLLDEREVVEKRTESSYTKRIGTTTNGDGIYELIAYSDKAFVERDGSWFARETGRTTATTFAAIRVSNPIASLFWEKAYASTISPFASAGDGNISASNGVWATAHDATTGGADSTSVTTLARSLNTATLYFISRAFLPFDTSALPSDATISAADLNVYVTAITDTDNDGLDYVTIVRTTQATHTTLEANDYDNLGTTEGIDSGQRKDLTSVSTSAYLTITLNATGLGWIAKSGEASNCSATTGITCLSLREGHDNANTAITANTGSSLTSSSSEETGTAQDPYFLVTYTAPGGATRVMRLLGNFRLRGVRLLGL